MKKNLYDQETYNVLTDNLTVNSIIEIIREIIPKININYVDSEIMNQLSYEVSSRKISQVGFQFSGSISDNIAQKINLLQLKS
jgi:UDP-glucose 4-epimerase